MANIKNKIFSSFGWFASGLICSWISVLFFSLFASKLFSVFNSLFDYYDLSANKASLFFWLSHFIEYFICFTFTLFLSFFSHYTIFQLFLFIIGATAIKLYLHAEALFYYLSEYSELPTWVFKGFFKQYASLFVAIPLASILGAILGRYLKHKTHNKPPKPTPTSTDFTSKDSGGAA